MIVTKALVLGSGTIGLRTAQELLQRNVEVILHSARHPLDPKVCSMGAGGLWMPFHCDDPRTDRWAMETLDELLSFTNKSPDSRLVEVVPTVLLRRAPEEAPEWTKDPRLSFQQLSLDTLYEQNLKIPPQMELKEAGYQHAWFFQPPIVDAPNMLRHLLSNVEQRAAAVNLESATYESMNHLREVAKSLGCNGVVNCAGLGAANLCNDNELIGARGIVLNFDRKRCARRSAVEQSSSQRDAVILAEEPPFGSETMPAYLIPRGDVIVLGGTYLEGDTEESIRAQERERLMTNADRLGIDTKRSPIVGEWTGFRPVRPTSRCELDGDDSDGLRVVHSYGYGGSGWTVNVGAAKEATNILLRGK